MYNNMCFEDVSAARRHLDDIIENCERSTNILSSPDQACLVERIRVAQSLLVSVEEAIRDEL